MLSVFRIIDGGVRVATAVVIAAVLAFAPAVLWAGPVGAIEFNCAAVSEIPAAECAALVALYMQTDGANWFDRANWLVTNTPCEWAGVICNEGHVEELYLPANNLRGQIPAELADLAELAFLDLAANQLEGALPGRLSTLTTLEELYVYDNVALSGAIPWEFAGLGELNLLWYQGTQMCGVSEVVRAVLAVAEEDAEQGVVFAAAVSAFDGWLMGLESLQSSQAACVPFTLVPVNYLPLVTR